MDNEKFQELVLTQFEHIDQRFEKMDQRFEKIDQRFERIDQRLDMNEKFQSLALEHFSKMDDRLDKVETGLKKLQVHVENEITGKLNCLLDCHTQTAEILADHTKCLKRIEEKITDHNIHIQVLETKSKQA